MTDAIKKVETVTVKPATETKAGAANKEAASPNSIITPDSVYNGVNAQSFMNNFSIMGGMNGTNPSWYGNNAFTKQFTPEVGLMLQSPQFMPQFSFGGVIQRMFDFYHKTYANESKDAAAVAGGTTPAGTVAQDPAAKLQETRLAAYKLGIPYDEKDTQETLDKKIADKTKANEAAKGGAKAGEEAAAGGATHKKHHGPKAAGQTNVNDIKFEGKGNKNHLYTDKDGNRICERYKNGKLVDTLTFKDGALVSTVKADAKAEAAKKATVEKETKKATEEASKICSQLYIAMKGAGTDTENLTKGVNKITKDNVVEVMNEWKKHYSSKMDNETLVESIGNDVYGAQKYTTQLKNALVERTTKIGLADEAQVLDAVVTSENKSKWYTNDKTVEAAFDETLELVNKAQKAD